MNRRSAARMRRRRAAALHEAVHEVSLLKLKDNSLNRPARCRDSGFKSGDV